jgi:hypothetical protein
MKCPHCRKDFEMREAMAEQEWVDVMQLLPVFGNHSRLAFEYVEKFSIHPMKLKVKKLLRLLTEIAGLFKTGKFILNRLEYEVSQRGIVEALTAVNNKADLTLPFTNHNYLKHVLAGISDRERKEARTKLDVDLRIREERATTKARRDESTKEESVLSAEENAKRARELVGKIGARS